MVVLTSAGTASLDDVVVQASKDPKIPSFVFGATNANGELYFKGDGYKVLNESSSGAVDENSVFWICSQSKMIIHLAALQLIEKGKLSLEDLVSDFLPEFDNPIVLDDVSADKPSFTPAREQVRIKHLLNFTSGLFYPWKDFGPDELPPQYRASHNKEDPIGEFFKNLKGDLPGVPLQFEPGTNWTYGFSSDVLDFVVERASSLTLEQYLRNNIFDPLEMKTSFYLTPELKDKQIALTIRKGDTAELFKPKAKVFETDPNEVTCHLGGIGLYSSARDYLKLLRHLLQVHAGTAKEPLFTKGTVAKVFEPALGVAAQKSIEGLCSTIAFSPHEGSQWSYAAVVNTLDWPGRRRKGSAYWIGWANTHHIIDPTTGVAAVFNTQLIPMFDKDILEYFAKFETALYGGLEG